MLEAATETVGLPKFIIPTGYTTAPRFREAFVALFADRNFQFFPGQWQKCSPANRPWETKYRLETTSDEFVLEFVASTDYAGYSGSRLRVPAKTRYEFAVVIHATDKKRVDEYRTTRYRIFQKAVIGENHERYDNACEVICKRVKRTFDIDITSTDFRHY